MLYNFYDQLPKDAMMIREQVFMVEQGFQEEFDERDNHCLHMVIYKDEQPIACARMYPVEQTMMLGRIAVMKAYRQQSIGSAMLKALESKACDLGYHTCALLAQLRAEIFYEKNGYLREGDPIYEEDCLHVLMKKEI